MPSDVVDADGNEQAFEEGTTLTVVDENTQEFSFRDQTWVSERKKQN
jgi:hypothetical protein